MSTPFRTRLFAALLPVALAVSPVCAANNDTGASATSATQSDFAEARAAVNAGQYAAALRLLAAVVKAEPRNADALNLMGYSNRKMNRLAEAARYYDAALKADPRHLGALEYQGELFVDTGDYVKARANLNRLAALCGTCAEYNDLHAALMAAGQG